MLYLVSKYGYGLIIRSFSPYASSTMQLLPAMVIISLIMLPRVHIRELIKNNRSGVVKVVLARIPNTLGMLLENAVISISLANYSFIQPMILVTLFVIGLIRREKAFTAQFNRKYYLHRGYSGFSVGVNLKHSASNLLLKSFDTYHSNFIYS